MLSWMRRVEMIQVREEEESRVRKSLREIEIAFKSSLSNQAMRLVFERY